MPKGNEVEITKAGGNELLVSIDGFTARYRVTTSGAIQVANYCPIEKDFVAKAVIPPHHLNMVNILYEQWKKENDNGS
jgi:hypothetical protein